MITAALPIAGRVTEVSPERPYLTVMLALDPAVISSALVAAGHLPRRAQAAETAIDVSPLDAGLLENPAGAREQLDAASAGYRFGYDDPSYFNREYKRFFVAPPKCDIQQLRDTAGFSTGI